MFKKYRFSLLFIALTFLINWLLIGLFLALGEGWSSAATPAVLVAYMFGHANRRTGSCYAACPVKGTGT